MTDQEIQAMADAFAQKENGGSSGSGVMQYCFIAGFKAAMEMTGFPKLIIEFNPDADETQYPFTAHLEGCKGMVVQATTEEGCVRQMAISCEVKMRYDVKNPPNKP